MGSIYSLMCPCCVKYRKYKRSSFDYSLTQELLEEYKSFNNSIDIEKISNIKQLKIKPAVFVRESPRLPSDLYKKLEYIGEGSYGTVIKVKPVYLNEERAMKIIKKTHLYYNVNEVDVQNEIKILKSLDHPNIIKIYEFFSDAVNYYIVNEYCSEGDLHLKIQNFNHLTEDVVKNLMKQIFSAVAYLHSKGIIHGDLKLENILIDTSNYYEINQSLKRSSLEGNVTEFDEYFDIKLIDFGCSKFFTKDQKLSDIIGTCLYIAPEVVLNDYDEKSDLWSCGVIMYILLSGKAPFYVKNYDEIMENIKKGKFTFDFPIFKKVSKSAIDLIKLLLNYDPKKRITARQALNHSWFRKEFDEFNIIDLNYSQVVLNNLKNFNAEQKFQQAVVTYIAHNLVKKAEMSNLRKIFSLFDKDNDGRISKIELKQAFSEVQGTILADIELDNIFKSIDHDNNGYIEYEEFLRATIDRDLLLSENNLKLAFNLFDLDQNGSISVDEIKTIIGGGRSIPDNVMMELLAEIEKTSDEEIDYHDFKKIMIKIVK
jgi:calcium-dependent protein kinase